MNAHFLNLVNLIDSAIHAIGGGSIKTCDVLCEDGGSGPFDVRSTEGRNILMPLFKKRFNEALKPIEELVGPIEPYEPSNLDIVAQSDVKALEHAQRHYGDSWKKRGGVGAFMMLARKWDRLENRLSNPPEAIPDCQKTHDDPLFAQYDIFGAIATDKRAEGIIDDIRDLRRYLLLVEAEMMARGQCPGRLGKDDEAFSKGPKAK